MKTALECMACYLRQTLQVVTISSRDPQQHLAAHRRVAEIISTMDMDQTPPENSVAVYQAIAGITGCVDPYLALKRKSNEQAIALLPECKKKMLGSDDPLATALRLAIGGNIIDYGAMRSFNIDAALKQCLKAPFVVDHSQRLLQQIRSLAHGAKVLYLADNSGEIVYDSLVVEIMADMGLDVTVAVKSGAIINDALLEDAHAAGIDTFATILENGTHCPGTPLESCSEQLLQIFHNADLIISKGQGNFETLSEVDAQIYFLLTVKCSVVGAHLAEISGTSPQDLPGNGELVLFYYNGKKNA